jgi:hypothetical protein
MTRRWFGLTAAAFCLRADEAQDVWNTISSVVTALSQSSVSRFLAGFDPSMPDWATLQSDVTALLTGWQVAASVELVRSEAEAGSYSLELDWALHIIERADTARATRRRLAAKCHLALHRKQWRIVQFEPLELFAPPRVVTR